MKQCYPQTNLYPLILCTILLIFSTIFKHFINLFAKYGIAGSSCNCFIKSFLFLFAKFNIRLTINNLFNISKATIITMHNIYKISVIQLIKHT